MKQDEDWKIFDFSDIHSHVEDTGRVLSVDFTSDALPESPQQFFTLGIHPWNADKPVDWEAFESALNDPRVVGIGEAGLDSMRGPSTDQQLPVFMRQIEIAEKLGIPLVIHSVRSNHKILELKKKYNPSVPWIIHGFRGKKAQALQLLENGLHLSLGSNHNPEIATLPFLKQIHYESDELKRQ